MLQDLNQTEIPESLVSDASTLDDDSEQKDGAGGDSVNQGEYGEDASAVPSDSGMGLEIRQIALAELCPAALMNIPIVVSGRSCNALMDSGAMRSIIHRSVLDEEEQINTEEILTMTGLGGGEIKSLGSVDLEIQIHGRRMKSSTFVVVCDGATSSPVILGSNFFSDNSLEIDLARRRISQVSEDGSRWEYYVPQEDKPCKVMHYAVPVFASETVEIMRGSVVFVSAVAALDIDDDCPCASSGKEYYFSDCILPRFNGKVAAVDGVVHVERGAFRIMLSKLDLGKAKKDVINEGEQLGMISTMVDEFPANSVDVTVSSMKREPWTIKGLKKVVKLGDHLTEEQSELVFNMLVSKAEVLSTGGDDIGQAAVVEHRIELYDDTPIKQKPRRFPEPVVDAIEKECRELEELGVIEKSSSPWSSPVVPVKKKDGSMRLCIDYRKLNEVTISDRFPMPNLSDMVFGLNGMEFFTCLDLVKGYYQIPLEENSKQYTAFSTTRSHYQFRRLSFGMKNAPLGFQRQMQDVFSAYHWKQVIVYIDDVLIMEKEFIAHLNLVAGVLDTLWQYGMKIKPEKCHWFCQEVPFLGHVVGKFGLKKSDSYIKSIRDFPKPETVKQLRQFLGLLNFQHKFVPECSVLARPLSQCSGGKSRQPVTWTSEMENAFIRCKEEMCKEIQLAFPDYSVGAPPLELSVDASGYGAGASLSQWQEGCTKVIAYASITFSRAERHYSTVDRELAALRWAVGAFSAFLYGIPFVIYTDHRPLVYLNNMARHDSRIMRTLTDLAEFDFKIHYRPGKENVIADTLSRELQYEIIEDRLAPNYLPEGLQVLQTVEGGGDSLPTSLLLSLRHHKGSQNPLLELPVDHETLRAMLVDEILERPADYGLKPDRNGRKLWKMMRDPGQVCGDEVIMAFVKLFDIQVWVHHGMDKPVIFAARQQNGDSWSRIHLQCLAGIHFNPVVENLLYKAEEIDHQRDIGNVKAAVLSYTGNDDTIESTSNGQLDTDDSEVEVAMITDPLRDTIRAQPACQHHCESLPIITVCLHDKCYCALLDTGAQVSLVNEEVFQQMTEDQRSLANIDTDVGVKLRGMADTDVGVMGVASIELEIEGERLATFPFAVIHQSALHHCFLLGANFINAMNLKLNYDNMTYTSVRDDHLVTGHISTTSDVLRWEPHMGGYCGQVTVCDVPRCLSSLLSQESMVALQSRDYAVRLLKKKVEDCVDSKDWTKKCIKRFKRYQSQLHVHDNVLYYDTEFGSAAVVPFTFLVQIVLTLHREMAHVGRHKIVNLTRHHCWHPSLEEVARDVCSSCKHCQLYKIDHQTVTPPTLKIKAACPFDLVAMDIMMLPRTSSGHMGCLTVVDHYSKWLMVIPLKDKTCRTVVSAVENRVLPALPSCPRRILTDNGPEFVGDGFKTLLRNYGIPQVFTTPYHASSNGAVERVNRSVAELLRGLAGSQEPWDRALTRAIMVYNSTWHSELRMSPSDCILRVSHDVNLQPPVRDDVKETWVDGHPKFTPFLVGQRVAHKVHFTGRQVVDKLKPKYDGPHKIVRVHSNGVAYEIEKLEDPNKGKICRVHFRQIKAWRDPPAYLTKHPAYRRLEGDEDEHRIDEQPEASSYTELEESRFYTDDESECSEGHTNGEVSKLELSSLLKSKVLETRRVRLSDKSIGIDLEHLPCSEAVESDHNGLGNPLAHSTPMLNMQQRPAQQLVSSVTPATNQTVDDHLINILGDLNHSISVIEALENSLELEKDERSNEVPTNEGVRTASLIKPVAPVVSTDELALSDFSGGVVVTPPMFGPDSGGSFEGFGETSDGCNSLGSIKSCLRQARLEVLIHRRRSRERFSSLYGKHVSRENTCSLMSESEAVETADVLTELPQIPRLFTPRRTRSSGPVPDVPNVQFRPIEYPRAASRDTFAGEK